MAKNLHLPQPFRRRGRTIDGANDIPTGRQMALKPRLYQHPKSYNTSTCIICQPQEDAARSTSVKFLRPHFPVPHSPVK